MHRAMDDSKKSVELFPLRSITWGQIVKELKLRETDRQRNVMTKTGTKRKAFSDKELE